MRSSETQNDTTATRFTTDGAVRRWSRSRPAPELNFTAGSVTPMGKDAQTFTRVAGGFAVGGGYMF